MGMIAELLQQKVGLNPEQAQQAEEVVVQHIMANVPSEFQGILGTVIGTGESIPNGQQPAAGAGGLGGLVSEATSLFGGNKG